MQLAKVELPGFGIYVAIVKADKVHLLPPKRSGRLADVLHATDPMERVNSLLADTQSFPIHEVNFLAPVDHHEIWAAGVTYKRSQEARERESVGAAKFYDLVYSAPRPELFFKATAPRVVGSGDPVRIRNDARWSVPEPELALIVSPALRIVGYTIGNDMSSRDIEGENPLYLPQAKVYSGSCALGPVITLAPAMPPLGETTIKLTIERARQTVYEGSTSVGRMNRTCEDLVEWLGRENEFPDGVVLLTGTGIVPPDDFTLASDDMIHIDISGIGRLSNPVA